MAEVKTIKGVDNDTWAEFKSLAAKNNQTMGSFFEKMVAFYKHDSKSFWKDILYGEKILSDKEAEDMMRYTKKIRKEKWLRT